MSIKWTRFMDMHSGGGQKGPAAKILIEAPEAEARVIFFNRFGLNPDRVSCTCCGEDFGVGEHDSLAEATAFDRNCHHVYFFVDEDTEVPGQSGEMFSRPGTWDREKRADFLDGRELVGRHVERGDASGYRKYMTLDDYLASREVLVVCADEIQDSERVGAVPPSGYVWVD